MKFLPMNNKKINLIICLVLFGGFSFLQSVSAQTTNTTSSPISLAFSPPIIEITLDPGEAYTDVIKVENRGSTSQTFYPAFSDFLPVGETGGQEFLSPEEANPIYSLSKWVSFPSEPLTLRPNEGDTRQFTITVPKDALPGGRYAALFFDTKAPESQDLTGARIQTRTGPLLLVTVTGEVKESLKSLEFSSNSSFYEKAPVSLVSRIQNDGTVHVKPIGQVTVKNMFGKVVGNIPVNEKLANILPNSTRRFDLNFDPQGKFLIGKYEAILNLNYGSEPSKSAIDVVSFWIIPWKLIIIILLIILIIFISIKFLLKKYNNWVINKSKNSNDSSTSSINPNIDNNESSKGSIDSIAPESPAEQVDSIVPPKG